MVGRIALGVLAVGAATALSGAASAQAPHDGASLFKQRCAQCHETGAGHAPTREALGRRSPVNIKMALLTGAMKPQAVGLSDADITSVITYLTADAAGVLQRFSTSLGCLAAASDVR